MTSAGNTGETCDAMRLQRHPQGPLVRALCFLHVSSRGNPLASDSCIEYMNRLGVSAQQFLVPVIRYRDISLVEMIVSGSHEPIRGDRDERTRL